MQTAHLLDPEQGTLSRGSSAWEQEAVRRLALVGRLGATFGLLGVLLLLLRQENTGPIREGLARPWWPGPVWVVASAALTWAMGRPHLSTSRKVDLGLGWMVLSGVLAAVFRHGLPYEADDVVRGISPVAVVVLLFAVIVPVPPRRLVAAALPALIADPVALAGFVAWGHPNPPQNLWLWLHLPDAFALPVAWVTAGGLFDLREQAARARELGAYRLERRLGAGGMGEVWVARHGRLAQPVAVKLVRPAALATSERVRRDILARFAREARITARLRSPHTVRVFDFGTTDDGTFYYAMELLDGIDLDSLVARSGPLPPARARHLLLQVCEALAEAHEAGLIHRDVKPANVIVGRKGLVYDAVTVLDFGLARDLAEDDARLTTEGAMLGSPVAMAPEVARRGEGGVASDLYGVGCIAFQLLTGEPVFRADGVSAWLVAHASEAPRRVGTLVSLPDALDALVDRLLSKDPGDRPASAIEVITTLRDLDLPAWTEEDASRAWSDLRETGAPVSAARTSAGEETWLESSKVVPAVEA